jgi:hypothetical protein
MPNANYIYTAHRHITHFRWHTHPFSVSIFRGLFFTGYCGCGDDTLRCFNADVGGIEQGFHPIQRTLIQFLSLKILLKVAVNLFFAVSADV